MIRSPWHRKSAPISDPEKVSQADRYWLVPVMVDPDEPAPMFEATHRQVFGIPPHPAPPQDREGE